MEYVVQQGRIRTTYSRSVGYVMWNGRCDVRKLCTVMFLDTRAHKPTSKHRSYDFWFCFTSVAPLFSNKYKGVQGILRDSFQTWGNETWLTIDIFSFFVDFWVRVIHVTDTSSRLITSITNSHWHNLSSYATSLTGEHTGEKSNNNKNNHTLPLVRVSLHKILTCTIPQSCVSSKNFFSHCEGFL